ncbi:GH32 C-terminal domain-containing protein [Paenibacillus sp. ClWae2A]|uniref:GH32 C-terminal domain-containing protein n=1 Tax=Paenibacillus sp. ClWae2A TaxID=3057177 RepID=UPI0028F6BE07|nr:GH32 C-terminal domain-containing protein [Paenibacillus sp. ClWae2A]MDT9717887.1 GH32 C-terminal domain-containing protein [Paenibacillus sp. ClWae2A]
MNDKSRFAICLLMATGLALTSNGIFTSKSIAASAMPADQETNKQAKEELDIFESASKSNTNLIGWQVKGKGGLEDTSEGILLTSQPKENVMALSETVSDDFIYEADVMIRDTKADATLLFRSNEDGFSSYMLQIVPEAGLIRLRDARNGDGRLKEEREVSVEMGQIYHLKVEAVGSLLKVYWGNQYKPLIDVQDISYQSGKLGLHVWDGSALFSNIVVSDLKGNLGIVLSSKGKWQPDIGGKKGLVEQERKTQQIYNKEAADMVYEGNITLRPDSIAALAFRTSTDGAEGYEATLTKEGDQVRVSLTNTKGVVIASSQRTYPSQMGAKHHVEIKAKGDQIQVFLDGYTTAAIDVKDSTYRSGSTGIVVKKGTAYFQDTYVTELSQYYNEIYRPQYHYTPIRGSASDPNGLVYFEGEYHVFHQDGGTWAHAVSTDMLNWKRLPIALPWNDNGHVWSGSAVADMTNASGLFGDSGGKGLIAYYTSFNPDSPNGNQRIGLAYSKDQGRTWEYSKEHPIVIENPGKSGNEVGNWDFRDPKVIRDDENNRWVMVVSGGDHIRFYTSTNLLDWKLTDNWGYGDYVRGGVWECPDLFQLPVDGTSQKKWVMMISTGANPKTGGSDAEYFIGHLTADGKFVNDNPAGKVLRTDFGKEFYASMSFANMPDHRTVMMAWMTNWDYPFAFPTSNWKGELTIPREVSLVTTKDGIRMVQSPIKELESLRKPLYAASNKSVSPSSGNLLKGIISGAYEIEAEIEIPETSTVTEFGFNIREGANQKTVVGYKANDSRMFVDRTASGETDFSNLFSKKHEAATQMENNRIKMRILVDESSVEAFGNNGKVVFSDVIFPDPASRAMSFYVKGGNVNVVSLKVHQLQSVWNEDIPSKAQIKMDTRVRELGVSESDTLQAMVEYGPGLGVQPLKWNSSNNDVIAIDLVDNSHAVIKAKKEGESTITVSTPNGKTSTSALVKVIGGEFRTNLSGWTKDLSAASWLVSEHGIRGKYFSDANYIAKEKAGNFTYEADIMLGETGGAGSILFRASEDGRSGYYLNLDPNMKAIRLFYKINGGFEERQVLAKVPTFIQPGQTYKVKIEANGPHIVVHVDSQKVIDIMDGTFAEGHFGLHVFGGSASYQNVNVSNGEPANITKSSLVNVATQKSIYTVNLVDGEHVTLQDASATSVQKWVFVPTGDEAGSYSIRTTAGQTLDLDIGQNKLQLYHYLGYNNQRWVLHENKDGSVHITSAYHQKALEVSEDGTELFLSELNPSLDRQKWILTK